MLGRIWNLADTEQRGALNSTDFVVAMHLLTSSKSGALRQLPAALPPGLYEAASRRPPARQITGGPAPGRPGEIPPVPGIPKQFSGSGAQRTASPMTRPGGYGTPPQSAQSTGTDWAITPAEKAQFDSLFNTVDKMNRGYITGEEAVPFFGNSHLPEETLAQIWDLADINSEGHLNRDEFAVAIHLIRKQRIERGALPATLPANLIPPSMRQQVRPPAQPTAPAFDNAAYATTKSASDDLFGLDSFTPSSPSAPTGGSSLGRSVDSDVFAGKKSPASPNSKGQAPTSPQSVFKPFVPSSSFGQNMMTSTGTGGSGSSGPSQSRGMYGQQPSAMEDLLGDNDPEVSRKLTTETTDLANLSNQVGTLNKQMQDVKTKRTATEQDLTQVSSQKHDFELRLSQLQSHYEQEVKDVKTLESRLSESRSETQKLQQDCTGLEATLQDLQTQHRQVVGALESDQRENTNLKDRIKSINADIAQLRPQLEKLRSDARQQKGLVSINKKQLSTTEGDRDRIRNEMTDLSKEQESSRSIDPTSQLRSPGNVISPALSTASGNTNPFFRKSPTTGTEAPAMSPAPFSPSTTGAGQSQLDYDDMFGPSYPSQTAGPPPTSFRSESQSAQLPIVGLPSSQSVRSSEGPDVPTPVSSPPASSYHESPRSSEPPAPPESRQITSSFLPLRSEIPRNDSFSSSVKVAPPASRYGERDFSGADTPTDWISSTTETERDASKSVERADTSKTEHDFGSPSAMDRNMTGSPSTTEAQRSIPHTLEHRESYQSYGGVPQAREIPGAFPGDTNSPVQTNPTGESTLSDRSKTSSRPSEGFQSNRSEGYQSSRNDPFAVTREQTRGPSATKEDVDAAFAGFGGPKTSQERQNTGGSSADGSVGTGSVGAGRYNQEFPPIKEFGNDADSDSGSEHEHGFADNFTNASPHQRHGSSSQAQYKAGSRPGTGQSESTDAFGQRPQFSTTSTASQLPTPGAQKSPPTYDQTVGSPESQGPRDPNQFPPAFGGLLPARQDPTSPTGGNDEKPFGSPSGGQTLFGGSNASKGPSSSAPTAFSNSPPLSNTPLSTAPSDAYQSAVSHPSVGKGPSPSSVLPTHGTKSSAFDDDFDREFGDLSEAKEADEKGDDDFGMTSHHREGLDEFNPVFDSPQVSKSNTMASQQTATGSQSHAEDSFNDFEHNIGGPAHSTQPKVMPQVAAASHDWDAIFSGTGSDTPQASTSAAAAPLGKSNASGPLGTSAGLGSAPAAKAPLIRTMTSGTDDDPTLKQLTGMGYPREASIDALERYDYNVDSVSSSMRNELPNGADQSQAADFLVRNSKDI
jgi:epidermal growth factor receptor substrate 15